jgi:hypothetical protein
MSIETGANEPVGIARTNYSVVRVKRDILRRSSIGALFTNRSPAVDGGGANQTYGADASFALFTNLQLGGYYARTETPSLLGDNESYQLAGQYNGDKYGVSATRLKVGADFNPEIGFMRRSDFENSDRFTLEATREFENITTPFSVSSDLEVGVGPYAFTSYRASYQMGEQRRASGTVAFQWGDFYDGTIRAISVNQGRLVVTNQLSIEPGVSLNLIDLPQGDANQTVLRLRSDYAFTPRMFASALMQYNTADRILSTNLRFRWEYSGGSEFFVVWTDERDRLPGGTGLRTRALAVKITRLLRY